MKNELSKIRNCCLTAGIVFLPPLIFICITANAEPLTNQLFRTTSTGGVTPESDIKELLMKGANARYGQEMLPAEEDPEGNWGPSTNGMQMSARFYQTNFTVGQPVPVVILLRNVGKENVSIGSASWVNYPYFLILKHDEKEIEPLVPPVKPGTHDGSAWSGAIKPKTQRRDVLRLDTIFDLSQLGAYELIAERGGIRNNGVRVVKAYSGVAKFWIVPKAETKTNSASPYRYHR